MLRWLLPMEADDREAISLPELLLDRKVRLLVLRGLGVRYRPEADLCLSRFDVSKLHL
jgi:hypothetical protein